MLFAAATVNYSFYSDSSCNNSMYQEQTSIGFCAAYNDGTSAEYYQKTDCAAVIPSAKPTLQPTGPSRKPTPQPTKPTSKPTARPTAAPSSIPSLLPTVNGAITSGYYVTASYSDPLCANLIQMNVVPIGKCQTYSRTFSQLYLGYNPKSTPWGYDSITVVYFRDGSCGSIRFHYDMFVDVESSCTSGSKQFFSPMLPIFPVGIVTMYVGCLISFTGKYGCITCCTGWLWSSFICCRLCHCLLLHCFNAHSLLVKFVPQLLERLSY